MTGDDLNPSPLRSGEFHPELTPAQFEAEFWGRILQRQPYYEDVLRRQAENLARSHRYEEVLAIDRRIVELRPNDPVVHYNLACTLARLSQTTDALSALQKAVHLGYDDFEHLESDPDLDCLRELPGYRRLLKRRHLA